MGLCPGSQLASVGSLLISRSGAGAGRVLFVGPVAILGRCVMITWNWAGITSSRSDVSSPITSWALGSTGSSSLREQSLHPPSADHEVTRRGPPTLLVRVFAAIASFLSSWASLSASPARYPRVPGAAGRDRASPSVCRSAHAAAGGADGASDRCVKARGRVRQSQRHAPHTPPPPAHVALRCRQEADCDLAHATN